MTDDGGLSPDELARYARQIGPGVLTPAAQSRLRGAAVLVTRAGGMGGPAALALAMAGVGRIILAHSGTLTPPDLNRQVLGDEGMLGQLRAAGFAARLRAVNSSVEIEPLDHEPDDAEALALARRVDVIVSAAPTFAERLRLNAAAVEAGVPLVDAAQWGMGGTLLAVDPGRTACLRCIYPQDPPFEELFPVLGGISTALGGLAAVEVVKIVGGVGQPLFGRLWMIDSFHGRWSEVRLRRDPDCSCCGGRTRD